MGQQKGKRFCELRTITLLSTRRTAKEVFEVFTKVTSSFYNPNMYSINTTAILFIYIFAFAFETTFAAENGYIVQDGYNIPCLEPTTSVVYDSCSRFIDHKIPDLSEVPDATEFQSASEKAKNFIPQLISALKAQGNDECTANGTKYYCSLAHSIRCEEKYISVDGELIAKCRQAYESCSTINSTLREGLFNCSDIKNELGQLQKMKKPRNLNCVDFPTLEGDPYTCNANYKVSLRLEQRLHSIGILQ